MAWVCARLCKLQKMCTRLAATSYTGTPASPTTKSGCHNISEILLKVALNTINHLIKILNRMCKDIAIEGIIFSYI
jgi:hypothetical protein